MRYSFIDDYDLNNNEKVSVTLWVQGCKFHCKSCHNKHTWDLKGGKEFTSREFNYILDSLDRYFPKDLSILGGEPLLDEHIDDLTEVCKNIKRIKPDTKIWLWTGNLYEDVRKEDIMKYLDVIIDGLFIEDLKDSTLKFRGSSNQRVIDVKESLKQNKLILYCE